MQTDCFILSPTPLSYSVPPCIAPLSGTSFETQEPALTKKRTYVTGQRENLFLTSNPESQSSPALRPACEAWCVQAGSPDRRQSSHMPWTPARPAKHPRTPRPTPKRAQSTGSPRRTSWQRSCDGGRACTHAGGVQMNGKSRSRFHPYARPACCQWSASKRRRSDLKKNIRHTNTPIGR